MKIYVGQTRAKKLTAELAAKGWGEMTQPTEYPPRRTPWVLDNAAFKAWKGGTLWDRDRFEVAVQKAIAEGNPPEWIVVPDIVAGGRESLRFSKNWLRWLKIHAPGVGHYLAVQDGMVVQDVAEAFRGFTGIFVGGTKDWKIKTGAQWVQLAHLFGLPCHIGRVGTAKRVRWAIRTGCDSIDSCLPLWSKDNLRVFEAALEHPQGELF